MVYDYDYETDCFEIYFPGRVQTITYLDEFAVVEGESEEFCGGAVHVLASLIQNGVGFNPTQKELDDFIELIRRKQDYEPGL